MLSHKAVIWFQGNDAYEKCFVTREEEEKEVSLSRVRLFETPWKVA